MGAEMRTPAPTRLMPVPRSAGTSIVERWKGPFNEGTAKAALVEETDGSWWGALELLDEALERVPDEQRCMVQLNRAWGEIMAYLSMITVPVLAFYLYMQRSFIASIASTGVKG